MENKTPSFKDHVTVLEKAIDIAINKGCYNKMEIVQLVHSLTYLYQQADKHSAAQKFEGVIPD